MKRPEPLLFGKYRLVERIAQSETAHVFDAKAQGAEGFEKPLVIKLIRSEIARMPGFAARFAEHAKRALSLSHANIVQLYDFGEIQGSLFMAMEQVAGSDLGSLLDQRKRAAEPLAPGVAVHIANEVARALDYAHLRRGLHQQLLGVVHGRVCPSSILLSTEGEVKVANFGLGRALQDLCSAGAPTSMGKPAYMSPEQARGEPIDGRSDVFSLAAVLYECLSGIRAFEGRDAAETLDRVRACRYARLDEQPLGLPVGLCATVHKALQLRPEHRHDTVGQLCDELARSLALDGFGRVGSRDVEQYVAGVEQQYRQPLPSQHPLALPRATRRDCTLLVLRPFESKPPLREIELALERHGGRALGARGDDGCSTFVFGLDEPNGRDAEAALGFVEDLRRAWAQTHPALASFSAGLDCGTVWFDATQPQDASPWASLLLGGRERAHSAEPGATWVSAELARLAAGSFLFRPAGSEADSWAVVGQGERSREPSRLVGRESSLRRFGELLARAWRSSPNRILIEGETGIGKSRLLQEAISELRAAGHQVAVHVARLGRECEGQPFAALAQMLRTLVSAQALDSRAEIAGKAMRLAEHGLSASEQDALQFVLQEPGERTHEPTGDARELLAVATTKLVRSLSSERLSLFVFEAAERIDAPTLELLERCVTREDAPNAVLLFMRTLGLPCAAPVFPSCHRVELGPLSRTESRELFAAKLELGAIPERALSSMLRKTAGHPLFIEQYAQAFRETGGVPSEIPRRVRGTVAQRLDRLRAEARAVVELVSLVDAEIDIVLLAELLDWPVSKCAVAVTDLRDALLLERTGPERYKLRSEIVAEVVRMQLPRELRHELHLAVAQLMERHGDWTAAISQLEQALDTWPRSSSKHSLHLELYHRLGMLCVHARASERGAIRMVAALDLADALGRDDMAARFCTLRSELLAQNGQISESREWRERAQQMNALRVRPSGS